MRADAIPTKTDLGRQALSGREFPGTRAQRLFLIMVDGRKSMRELGAAASQLGIDNAALQALETSGLLSWLGPAAPAADKPVPRAASNRTLAGAKLYALDLATLMLQGQDGAVRDAARQVSSADQLQAWLLQTARRVAERAGEERGALFLAKVAVMLPDGMGDFVRSMEATDGSLA